MEVPETYAVFDPISRELAFVRGSEHDGAVWSASGEPYEGVAFDDVDDAPWQARPDVVRNVRSVRFDSRVRPTSCAHWFHGMASCEDIDLSGLDTSGVHDMSHMFQGCERLRCLDLSGLDTSGVHDMSHMLDGCSDLEECDLSGLDTSEVTDMSYMLRDCSSVGSVDLTGLDTSNVTSMRSMLDHCQWASSVDLSGLDTGSVTDMGRMFAHCWSLTGLDLSDLDMRRLADASGMLEGCQSLERLDLRNLDLTGVRDTDGMFAGCRSLRVLLTDGLATNAVARHAVDHALPSTAYAVIDEDKGEMDFVRSSSSVERGVVHAEDGRDYAGLVYHGFEDWDSDIDGVGLASHRWEGDVLDQVRSVRFVGTVRPYDATGWFRGMRNLESVDLSGLDTANCHSMAGMFEGCESLRECDMSGLDTSGVHDMSHMFAGCKALESVSVHVGGDVFDTRDMFYGCESLRKAGMSHASAYELPCAGGDGSRALVEGPELEAHGNEERGER